MSRSSPTGSKTLKVGDPHGQGHAHGPGRLQGSRWRPCSATSRPASSEGARARRRRPARRRRQRQGLLRRAHRSSTASRNAMTIAREEIFGPVLSVIPFKRRGRASRRATTRRYGLAAAVWTRDVAKALGPRKRHPRRHGLGERLQPVRRRAAVRRLQGIGLRPRAGLGRPRRATPRSRPSGSTWRRSRPAVVSMRRSTVVLVVLALVAVVPAVVVGCHFRGYVAGFMPSAAAEMSDISLPSGFRIRSTPLTSPTPARWRWARRASSSSARASEGKVYAVVDRDGNGQADDVHVLASGLDDAQRRRVPRRRALRGGRQPHPALRRRRP